MPDHITIKIAGAEDLEERLNRLGDKMKIRFTKRALKSAAQIILRSAKYRVPVDTGALRESMFIQPMRQRRQQVGVMVMMPPRLELSKAQKTAEKAARVYGEQGYYPAVVEYGSRHVAARPFLRPALASNAAGVISMFEYELRELLLQESVSSAPGGQ